MKTADFLIAPIKRWSDASRMTSRRREPAANRDQTLSADSKPLYLNGVLTKSLTFGCISAVACVIYLDRILEFVLPEFKPAGLSSSRFKLRTVLPLLHVGRLGAVLKIHTNVDLK